MCDLEVALKCFCIDMRIKYYTCIHRALHTYIHTYLSINLGTTVNNFIVAWLACAGIFSASNLKGVEGGVTKQCSGRSGAPDNDIGYGCVCPPSVT
jgi:hypothetical protein